MSPRVAQAAAFVCRRAPLSARMAAFAVGLGAATRLSAAPDGATDPVVTPDESSSTQQSQDAAPPPASLTGEWGGVRTALRDAGVDIGGNYKAEPAVNVVGGPRTGATAPSDLSARATLDLDRLLGVRGGTFQTSLSFREGTSLPLDLLQQAQEVAGRGKVVRLAELWYQQRLYDDAVTVKVGRMPEGDFNSFPCF